MRILQVLRAPVGGLFRHVGDLGTGLAARGHQVGLVVDSLASDAATEKTLARLAPSFELGIERVPMPRIAGFADLWAPGKLADAIRSTGAQIVHGHGAKGGFHARLAAGRTGIPAVYTPHGGVLHYPARSVAGRIFHTLERRLTEETDRIIFESEFARKAFAEQITDPGDRGTIIHNGLPEAEFEVLPVGNRYDFVFVGELRELKGVDLLLEALAVCRRSHPGTSLLIAGDGPDRQQYVDQCRALDLEDAVTFAGVQPAREMFAQGRCVTVPSRKESLPYVVIEATAAGRPVISTRIGGIAEIYGPTANTLIPAGSATALAAEMTRFLTDPNALIEEARVRRDFIASAFSLDTMISGIEAVYRELVPAE